MLTGHKWFCSAPMSDAFLVLAHAPGESHLLPGPAGPARRQPQRLLIQRLKDKLGNRSERLRRGGVRRHVARRVGEEGRGVRTIIGMVAATRLDCALGSAGLMRQAVAQAMHHVRARRSAGSWSTSR
ncbi:hypothetical protein LT493_39660 [Streptomyces tricolor]|nr:hypothetical protein [Streptomyces tricolor]